MSSEKDEQNDDDLPPTVERWPDRRVLSKRFRPMAPLISDMNVRDTDVWVATFPKSGTTWTQELVWLLMNNLDFETAKKVPLTKRARFLEFPSITGSKFVEDINLDRWMKKFENTNEPARVIKTHLNWARLPKQLQQPDAKAKIVYVARNPKDVTLSYYHFFQKLGLSEHLKMVESLDNFANKMLNSQVQCTPYWGHVKDYWGRRHQPNVLFLWYEDMKKDLEKEVEKVIRFLGVPRPSPERMKLLLDHLSFDSMKKNPAVNEARPRSQVEGGEESGIYVRKGQVGSWKNELSPEINARFDDWIKKNVAGTDLEEHYEDHVTTG